MKHVNNMTLESQVDCVFADYCAREKVKGEFSTLYIPVQGSRKSHDETTTRDSRDFGRDSPGEVNGNDKNYNGRVIKPVFFSPEEVSALGSSFRASIFSHARETSM